MRKVSVKSFWHWSEESKIQFFSHAIPLPKKKHCEYPFLVNDLKRRQNNHRMIERKKVNK